MKKILLFWLLCFMAFSGYAQQDELNAINKKLAEGNCTGAQKAYEIYRDNYKSDPVIERRIANCIASKASSTADDRWVDLGLPSGLLWAKCNLGATTPEEYGSYYAWGETSTKSVYDGSTYAYGSNGDQLTKYCDDSRYGLNGFTDYLTTLQSSDDAATAVLGMGARIPTRADWQELLDNTTSEWTTLNGVYGRKFTSKRNGKSLFLPAAGRRNGSSLSRDGTYGYYWSSSLDESLPGYAWSMSFGSDYQGVYYYYYRYGGHSVRAVRSQN